jgi:hypothetical protein
MRALAAVESRLAAVTPAPTASTPAVSLFVGGLTTVTTRASRRTAVTTA